MGYSSDAWNSGGARGGGGYVFAGAALFASVALEFAPWPGVVKDIKPLFPNLALVYLVIHNPRAVNYAAAVLLGVLMDLANQLPLGFTAISYSAMVFMTNGMRGRFSLLGPFGQAVHVLFVLCCGQALLEVLKTAESGGWGKFADKLDWVLFAPSIFSAGLWLFLPLLARRLGRAFRGDGS